MSPLQLGRQASAMDVSLAQPAIAGAATDDDSTRLRPVKRTYGRRREAAEDVVAQGASAVAPIGFDALYAAHAADAATASSSISWPGLEADVPDDRADNGRLLSRWETARTDFRSAVNSIPSPSKALSHTAPSSSTRRILGVQQGSDDSSPPSHRLLAGTKLGASDWRRKLARAIDDEDEPEDRRASTIDPVPVSIDAAELRRLAQEEISRKAAAAEPSSDLTSLETSSDPVQKPSSSGSSSRIKPTAGSHRRRIVDSSSSVGIGRASTPTEDEEDDSMAGLMPTQESPSVSTLRRKRAARPMMSSDDENDDEARNGATTPPSTGPAHSSSSLAGLSGLARRADEIARQNRVIDEPMELDALLAEYEQPNVPARRGLSKKAQLEMEKTQAEIRASKRVNLPRAHIELSLAAYATETRDKLEHAKRPITSVAPGLVPIRAGRHAQVVPDDEHRTPPSTSDDLIADFSSERTQRKTAAPPQPPAANVVGQLNLVPAWDEDQETPLAKRRRKVQRIAASDSEDDADGGLAGLVRADDKRRRAEEVQRRKAELALRKQEALAAAGGASVKRRVVATVDDDLELVDAPQPSRKPRLGAAEPTIGPKEALEGRANQGRFAVEQRLAAVRGNVKRHADVVTDSLIDVAKHSTFDTLLGQRKKGGKTAPVTIAPEDLTAQLLRDAKAKAQAVQAAKEKEFRYQKRVLNPKRTVDLQALVQELGPADEPDVSADEAASDDDSQDDDYRPDEAEAEEAIAEPVASSSRPRKLKTRVTDSDDEELAPARARVAVDEDDEAVLDAPPPAVEPVVATGFGFDDDDDGGFSQLFAATAAPAAEGFGGLRQDAPPDLEERVALPTAAISASAQARNEAMLAAEMMPQYEPTQQSQATEQRWLGADGFFTQTRPATQAMVRSRTEDSLADRSTSTDEVQLEATWQTPTERASVDAAGSPVASLALSAAAPSNAFDMLMAAKPQKSARDPIVASEELRGFIEDAAEESDEDGGFMYRRRDDDDEEDDADGDGVVEGLVDDQERTEEQLKEDELKALAKLREIEAEDDLERQRIAQDAVDGKMRTRRRDGTMRDLDFDSDDEERLRMKRPRHRKDRKRNLGKEDELDQLDGESAPFADLYRQDLAGSDDDDDEMVIDEPLVAPIASRSPTPEAPRTIGAHEIRQKIREMGDERRQRELVSSPEPMGRLEYGSDTEEDEPQSQFSLARETSRSFSRKSDASKDDVTKYARYLKNAAVQQADTNRTGKNMSVTGGGGGGSRSSIRALSDPSKKQNAPAKASGARSLSNVMLKQSGFN